MNKYRNKHTEVDGLIFDSKKEAERYCELKIMERAGLISDLQRQKRFELQPSFILNGKRYRPITYICDFYYWQNGKWIIEDVKSDITRRDKVYIMKKKLMAYKGMEIQEV